MNKAGVTAGFFVFLTFCSRENAKDGKARSQTPRASETLRHDLHSFLISYGALWWLGMLVLPTLTP
jgi:hypothetical protein